MGSQFLLCEILFRLNKKPLDLQEKRKKHSAADVQITSRLALITEHGVELVLDELK